MSDKVQLIKEEIERRIKNLEFSLENNCVEKHSKLDILGNITTLESLLQFLESIPEPASEDLEEEMIRWHKEHFGNKRDWEKTSGEYLTRKSQLDIAHHFAEWQKQNDFQDFMEKAEMYLKTRVYYNMHPNNVTTAIQEFKNYMQNESEN